MPLFKQDVRKANHQVFEWTEDIKQSGDKFEELLCNQFALYDTSTFKTLCKYMKKKRDLWEE